MFRGVLIQPLPFEEADRLTLLFGSFPDQGVPLALSSAPNLRSVLASKPRSIGRLEAVSEMRKITATAGDRPFPLNAEFITGGYLRLLGIAPVLGSVLSPDTDNQVLLSEQLWRTRFAEDPTIVGSSLRIDGQIFQVAGVLPNQYRGIEWEDIDVWLPLQSARQILGDRYLEDRSRGWLLFVARLTPGATAADSQAEMNSIFERLETQYPKANHGLGVVAIPIHEYYFQDSLERGLIFLTIVGAFVLALCFANTVSLLLGIFSSRGRSIATRLALGSSRRAVLGPYLLHASLLSLIGCTAALLASPKVTERLLSLSNILPASVEPKWFNAQLLALAAGLTVSIPLIASLFYRPALTRLEKSRVLATGRLEDRKESRTRQALLVFQVGIAGALLLGVGLLTQSLAGLTRIDAGFASQDLGLLRLDFGLLDTGESSPKRALTNDRLLSETWRLPGVESASLWGPQLPPRSFLAVRLVTDEGGDRERAPQVFRHAVGPDHLATLGIEPLEGRAIGPEDREDRLPVAVVSQSVTDRLWPEGAIGKTFRTVPELRPDTQWTVVGVAPDIKARGRNDLGIGDSDVYFPATQVPSSPLFLTFRSSVDPKSLEPALHDLVHRLDGDLALHPVQTMRERFADSAADERFATVLTGIFSLIALVIAGIGVHGVASLSVAQRTRELGIRMALGARPRQVLMGVLLRSLMMVAIGLALGILLALTLYRFIQGFLFGVGPFDPPSFVGVVLILGLVAIVGSVAPAVRAMRIDPSVAMRAEG